MSDAQIYQTVLGKNKTGRVNGIQAALEFQNLRIQIGFLGLLVSNAQVWCPNVRVSRTAPSKGVRS